MAQSSTKLNGNIYDFTTVSVTANGTPIVKGVFSEINYDASQEPGMVQGNQISPVGYTAGYANGTGSFKMLTSYFDDMGQELINEGWPDVLGVDFDIEVSFRVNFSGPNPANDTRLVKLIGCRITKYGEANTKGNEGLMTSCDLIIHRIITPAGSLFGNQDDANPL